jgi:drug/metabolite transporter (DMT)-like permease
LTSLLSFFSNGVTIAAMAHTVIGLSLIWDKVLLERPETKNVINYTFWLGAMSILGLCLIPFGFHWPGANVFWIAFTAGIVQLAANYFYYDTLKLGEASQTLAIMGGFSPLFTYLIALALLKEPLGGSNMLGFALMVAGGFFMFLSESIDVKRILPLTLMAATTFGLSSVLQKRAFEETNFVSGYVIFTLGTFAGALFLLIRRNWRDQIFRSSGQASPRSKEMYFLNRFISGVGSFLIFVAISRASPAIVEAISGLRYVIIFIGVYLITKHHPRWLHEHFHGWALVAKTIATALVVAGLMLIGINERSSA